VIKSQFRTSYLLGLHPTPCSFYSVFVQSVGIYVSLFSMFDRKSISEVHSRRQNTKQNYRNRKNRHKLDSFPFSGFSFPFSREKNGHYRRPFRLAFMFSEPEKMSNKSRFPFFPGSASDRCYSIAISLARKVCCLMKCLKVAAGFRVMCVEQYKV
jgi:hypothetical protein